MKNVEREIIVEKNLKTALCGIFITQKEKIPQSMTHCDKSYNFVKNGSLQCVIMNSVGNMKKTMY